MKLSVVIIAYNLERFVGEALDSVLRQSRPADEIIVIDDCSTDGTAAFVGSYSSPVKLHRMERNSGALLAALEGVRRATGDVVCMLDGDDVWADNKLEEVERCFAADHALMVLSHDHVRVDAEGRALGIVDETHRNVRRIRSSARSPDELDAAFRDTILMQRGYWLGSAYSFRRASFDRTRFGSQLAEVDPQLVHISYLDLVIAPFLVLTRPHERVGYTEKTWFLYRIHQSASLSANASSEAAVRSLSRGRAVNALVLHLMERNDAPPDALRRRRRLVAEYDYLSDLYRGNTSRALRRFAALATGLWSFRKAAKETVRLLGVIVVGPDRFLAAKQNRSFKASSS